jgi:hypothetical protein
VVEGYEVGYGQLPPVKPGEPTSSEAVGPLAFNEDEANSSTRLFPSSATHRLPEESMATPYGVQNEVAVGGVYKQALDPKFGCPITRLAAWSVENAEVEELVVVVVVVVAVLVVDVPGVTEAKSRNCAGEPPS